MSFIDPGEQKPGRRKTQHPEVPAPRPPNLFDSYVTPPETPARLKSVTSTDAVKESRVGTMSQRREAVLRAVRSAVPGLARFQIADRLGVPDHWCTSSVDALIKMGKIEESPTLTVINPKSGKSCAVLVALDTSEDAAA